MDGSFLRVETPTAHMHVGWLALVDVREGSDRLDVGELRARIAARLHLAPRFRQRVVQIPLGVAEPVWRDDPDFELCAHVSEVPARRPLDRIELRRELDAFLSVPLDRDRPLWDIRVVGRLRSGGAAILGKVHHAMVDGIAAVELATLLFDLEPGAAAGEPLEWEPEPTEGPLRLAVDSIADSALEQFRTAGRMASLGRSPARAVRVADTLRRAALSLAEDALSPAPESYLNPEIGPDRTLATHVVALPRLLTLRSRLDATLNDVVLAICAGAMRRFAARTGHRPDDLRVMVPVSVRAEGEADAGNRITFAFIDLPVSRATAHERLAAVKEQMRELKDSGRIAGSDALLGGLGLLPEPLKVRAARAAASHRLYNLTVSNVPGPRFGLYAAGGRVRSIFPVIPVPDRHALAIGVLTYAQRAHFAMYADPVALPRVHALGVHLEDAVLDLELEGRRSLRPPGPPRRHARAAPRSRARGPAG
jgi:diacylglycerol O-acyltransferase